MSWKTAFSAAGPIEGKGRGGAESFSKLAANRLVLGWDLATEAVGLGGGRKGGLIVHDLRRSAARNLRKAGVPESVAMRITGHKTRSIFDRYNIVDEEDVVEAMRKLEGSHRPAKSLAPVSESLVRPRRRKALNPA